MTEITLLLVDDEKEFRDATCRVLRRRGFQVREAESGKVALERLREEVPDLVLLDLRMEGMGGIDTLREIRKSWPDLPVIILTGHGGFDDAIAGIRLEIVDFLQKPVDVEQLGERIRMLLQLERQDPLRERRIPDLMVPVESYHRVQAWRPLREAIESLRDSLFLPVSGKVTERGHRTLLVYEDDGRFLGVLRPRDVLGCVIPAYLRGSPYASFYTGMFLAQSKVIGDIRVGDVVRQSKARGLQPTVDADAPLMEALHTIVSLSIINLPVMRGGEVVGVLRDKDLILEVAGLLS